MILDQIGTRYTFTLSFLVMVCICFLFSFLGPCFPRHGLHLFSFQFSRTLLSSSWFVFVFFPVFSDLAFLVMVCICFLFSFLGPCFPRHGLHFFSFQFSRTLLSSSWFVFVFFSVFSNLAFLVMVCICFLFSFLGPCFPRHGLHLFSFQFSRTLLSSSWFVFVFFSVFLDLAFLVMVCICFLFSFLGPCFPRHGLHLFSFQFSWTLLSSSWFVFVFFSVFSNSALSSNICGRYCTKSFS